MLLPDTAKHAWREAEEFLTKHGTILKLHQGIFSRCLVSMPKLLQTMKDFCSEFGLTPAARTRIRVEIDNDKSNDPMLKILKGAE